MTDSTQLDDMPGTGWRVWRISEGADGVVTLLSPHQGTPWPQGQLDAHCLHGDIDQCPGECGVRIWMTRELAETEGRGLAGTVIGRAAGWGAVRGYERAWLAPHAKVLGVDVASAPERHRDQLARQFAQI